MVKYTSLFSIMRSNHWLSPKKEMGLYQFQKCRKGKWDYQFETEGVVDKNIEKAIVPASTYPR